MTGNFTNDGTFNVASMAELDVTNSSGQTFTQNSGILAANGNFLSDGGLLLVNGGTLSGTVVANGSSLEMASTITVATSVYAWGNVTLVSNASAHSTVWVEGAGGTGTATLTFASGAVNAGTILLQPAASSGYRSNLSAPIGVTFVNAGTIQVNPSVNPSQWTGAIDNQGTINIAASEEVQYGDSSTTLVNSGQINLAAKARLIDAGLLEDDGQGSLNGPATSTIDIQGDLDGNTQYPALFSLSPAVVFDGSGSALSPQHL